MAKRTVRQISFIDDVAIVPLTKGLHAVIDAKDARFIEGFNWQAAVSGRSVYAQRHVRENGKRNAVLMHRVLADAPGGLEVDHIDSDGLNNRSGNLRVVTKAQNQQNARAKVTNTAGFKGVTLHKMTGRWQAKICANGIYHHLGLHKTPELAHAAYVAASATYHGEFGRTQ